MGNPASMQEPCHSGSSSDQLQSWIFPAKSFKQSAWSQSHLSRVIQACTLSRPSLID